MPFDALKSVISFYDWERYSEESEVTLAQAQSEVTTAEELFEALDGIISIGKRDMSNPKYEGYFRTAKEVLSKVKR